MLWAHYLEQLRAQVPRRSLTEYGTVTHNRVTYPLVAVESHGDRYLVVTSGIHGDETAGSLTLLTYLPLLLRVAKKLRVGLRVYPCVNPSGWERDERGTADGFSRNVNVVLQYDIHGVLYTELRPHQRATSFRVSKPHMMPEMRILFEDLVEQRPPAAWTQTSLLDLHQDGEIVGPRFYAYVFGDRARYRPVLAATKRLRPRVPPARNMSISALAGSKIERTQTWTDAHGLCEAHDGSLSDYLNWQGTPYNATLETTIDTPLPLAHAVHLTWLLSFMRLVREGVKG